MRALVWRAEARADVARIINYIAERNPPAARRMKRLFDAAVLPLVDHPYLFRPGRVPGTRGYGWLRSSALRQLLRIAKIG